jgi:hypothetical protein
MQTSANRSHLAAVTGTGAQARTPRVSLAAWHAHTQGVMLYLSYNTNMEQFTIMKLKIQ